MIAAVVLAAGAGRRFGTAPKQLALLDGRPLLAHALAAVERAGVAGERLVVLGAHADAVAAEVDLGGWRAVRCAGWERGPGASLRCGLAAAARAEADAVLVTLGDEPRLPPAALERLAAHADRRGALARATWHGRPGHPVLLGADHVAALLAARPTAHDGGEEPGPRALLARAALVACDDLGDPDDVDRPPDLHRLAALG